MFDNQPPARLRSAYYAARTKEFLQQSAQTILGHLAEHHAHDLDPAQRMAWLAQIEIFKREMQDLQDGWLALEFAIPRMGKRADAIIVFYGVIFCCRIQDWCGRIFCICYRSGD